MKTKRIVALALTAAMAVSMASMTAFAATSKWKDYQVGDGEENGLTDMIKVNDHEYYEGYVVKYGVATFDTHALPDGKAKNYTYRKGSTKKETLTNGNKITTYFLNLKSTNVGADGATTGDDTQTGLEEAGILWKNFKSAASGLAAPETVDEDNWVFLGWTVDPAKGGKFKRGDDPDDYSNWPINKLADGNWLESDKNADDGHVLKDTDDVLVEAAKYSRVGQGNGKPNKDDGSDNGTPIIFYPVFREKTRAEKLQSQVNISKRAKVAKPAGSKDGWVYTLQQLDKAKVSAPLAEDVSGDALKKCKTEMKDSRVYEVKPQAKDGTIVDLKSGTSVVVELPISTLYVNATTDGGKILGDKDKVNKMISQGKLKVFHIGSDGKSRQVTGIKSTEDGKAVTFKSGFFSEFVITKDPNSRAQAGEENGLSGDNPATGEASTLPVAMLALAALSATGVVAYKKRKAE